MSPPEPQPHRQKPFAPQDLYEILQGSEVVIREITGTYEPDPLGQEVEVTHFRLSGTENWGFTMPKISLNGALEKGIHLGYFHEHGDERVYIRPQQDPRQTEKNYDIILCSACKTGLGKGYGFPR